MSKDESDPNKQKEKLKSLQNASGRSLLDVNAATEVKVQIHPDTSVSPGKFLPHPLLPGQYKAHPTTIRAMKKDIFASGQDIIVDLERLVTCEGCGMELDLQFWIFCPFCEGKLPQ